MVIVRDIRAITNTEDRSGIHGTPERLLVKGYVDLATSGTCGTVILPMTGKQLAAIASKYGTPLYIYSKPQIERRLREITAIPYKRVKIFAATMANNSPDLLKLYKKHGLGVFVNSIKHFQVCKDAGFRGKEIMWTSTGMNERQMLAAIKEGVMLNLDSGSQVELYGRLNPGGKVGLRINIGDMPDKETYAGVFVGRNSRIGIFAEEINNVLSIAAKYRVKVIGLHMYLGTQIDDIDHFIRGLRKLLALLHTFKDLEYIDLGGGFAVHEGVAQQFDFKTYNKKISALMEKASKEYGKPLTLILEPGRVLAGDAGYFGTRVTDVKLRDDFKFISVDSSSAIFSRPLFYPDLPNAPHFVVGKEERKKMRRVSICGSTTYSRDFLARNSNDIPADIAVGDLVIFKNAGSYAYASRTDFLGIETPAQVLFDGKRVRLISPNERTISR